MPTRTTNAADPAPDLTARVRAAMPGIDHAEALAGTLDDQLAATMAALDRDAGADVTDAAAAILATGQVPATVGRDLLDGRRRGQEAVAAAEVIRRAAELHRDRMRTGMQIGADAGLSVVAAELTDILNQAGPVLAELGDVDSAAAAIEADVVSAWRSAAALVDRLREVRHVQGLLVGAALDPPFSGRFADLGTTPQSRALVEVFGCVRHDDGDDLAALHREHNARVRAVAGADPRLVVNEIDGRTIDRTVPTPWAGASLAVLRHLVDDGRAWVPSVGELRGAHRRAADVVTAANVDQRAQAEAEAHKRADPDRQRWTRYAEKYARAGQLPPDAA